MLEIHRHQTVELLGQDQCAETEYHRRERKDTAAEAVQRDGRENDGRLDQMMDQMILQMHLLPDRYGASPARPDQTDRVLDRQIQDDEPPRCQEPVHSLAVGADAPPQIVEQVHVDKQKDMVQHTVRTVTVDQDGAHVPDLQDDQRREDVRKVHPPRKKAALHLQQGVIPADQVHKDQIVDQLDVLDFLPLPGGQKAEHVRDRRSSGSARHGTASDVRRVTALPSGRRSSACRSRSRRSSSRLSARRAS